MPVEVGKDVYTLEQAEMLCIELPRQSWRERMMQRTRLVLKWIGAGALSGGIAVPAVSGLLLEGSLRLAAAAGQFPQDENLFQSVRIVPFYVAPLTALVAAFQMGLAGVVYGERISNLSRS